MTEVLVPRPRPGQMVEMDNLSAHKIAVVAQVVQAAGCRPLYLPSYSPDLNPIEPAWSKVKAWLRSAKLHNVGALEQGVGQALATVTAQEAHGFSHHCGYPLQPPAT